MRLSQSVVINLILSSRLLFRDTQASSLDRIADLFWGLQDFCINSHIRQPVTGNLVTEWHVAHRTYLLMPLHVAGRHIAIVTTMSTKAYFFLVYRVDSEQIRTRYMIGGWKREGFKFKITTMCYRYKTASLPCQESNLVCRLYYRTLSFFDLC